MHSQNLRENSIWQTSFQSKRNKILLDFSKSFLDTSKYLKK